MIILSIETSCDETSVAVLKIEKGKIKILADIISSQIKLHAKYGGVYPSLAKREHQKNLPFALKKALKTAKNPKIDLIGVTIGPGLDPCLWVGVNFVKELARGMNLQIIPVNHIEAHILANFIDRDFTSIKLPATCLVVSGGHTQLILMRDIGKYKLIGETCDDAAGECFDKIARILGLGYPGGPVIAKLASQWKLGKKLKPEIKLPRPMLYTKDYDFSFSGLKTAVLYDFQKRPLKVRKSKDYIKEICFKAQQAIIDVLIKKTIKAAKDYRAKSIILGGGVSANRELRKQLGEKIEKEIPNTKYLLPDIGYCTDNAVMVGLTSYFNWRKKKKWGKIIVDDNLRV